MKRSFALPIAVAAMILAAPFHEGAASRAQQKKATAREKMASVDYLVGNWSCAHTVGTFSGKYNTTYTKVLGDLWLKQTYDFPPKQFGGSNELLPVTAEALIGYDEGRVTGCLTIMTGRHFLNRTSMPSSIRMSI